MLESSLPSGSRRHDLFSFSFSFFWGRGNLFFDHNLEMIRVCLLSANPITNPKVVKEKTRRREATGK